MSGNIVVPMSFVLVCDDVYNMMNSRAVCTLVRSVTGFVSSSNSKPFFVATGGADLAGVLFYIGPAFLCQEA